jgi:hypothetical protein
MVPILGAAAAARAYVEIEMTLSSAEGKTTRLHACSTTPKRKRTFQKERCKISSLARRAKGHVQLGTESKCRASILRPGKACIFPGFMQLFGRHYW